jgi:hypothetical protein
MTFTELIAGIVIFSLFIAGFSASFFPALEAWNRASNEYRLARSIDFVAASFRKECAKANRNMESWQKAVSAVKELDSCEIGEIRQDGVLRALKLSLSMGGVPLEVIGLCTP